MEAEELYWNELAWEELTDEEAVTGRAPHGAGLPGVPRARGRAPRRSCRGRPLPRRPAPIPRWSRGSSPSWGERLAVFTAELESGADSQQIVWARAMTADLIDLVLFRLYGLSPAERTRWIPLSRPAPPRWRRGTARLGFALARGDRAAATRTPLSRRRAAPDRAPRWVAARAREHPARVRARARLVGADILELDVHATRDGQAVVIHDATVDRTTDGMGPVAAHTLEQLQPARRGASLHADGGRPYPFRGRGVRVPTLREVLDAFPATRGSTSRSRRPRAGTGVGGGARRPCGASGADRRRQPGEPLALRALPGRAECLGGGHVPIPAAAPGAADAPVRTEVDAFQMPERNAGMRVLTPDLIAEVRRLNLAGPRVDGQRGGGHAAAAAVGVDGIISDRPDLLARVLHEVVGRPLPPGPPAGEAEPFMERLLRPSN
jgi:glycerophosphoryl diester phosphodiesterase